MTIRTQDIGSSFAGFIALCRIAWMDLRNVPTFDLAFQRAMVALAESLTTLGHSHCAPPTIADSTKSESSRSREKRE